MSDSQNHALVFGATGLIGWAVVDQLLSSYPTPTAFASVIGVSNRLVDASRTFWPEESDTRPDLQLVSGVNLQSDDVTGQLKEKVPGIERTTHVFYFVFAPHNESHEGECQLNSNMMRNLASALNTLAPHLKSFVYSGGTRGYGIYIPDGIFTPPLKESMADDLPADYAKTVAYPWFREILTEASKGGDWTWTEVCPDVVVGFSPIGSNFSLALHWAQYLSLYAHNHGIGNTVDEDKKKVEIPFPGNNTAYHARFTGVSSHILGRIAIHAALNPSSCGSKIVNMLDSTEPSTFAQLWPSIASYFGLSGVAPVEDGKAQPPSEYIDTHRHLFEENGKPDAIKAGVGAGSKQLDSVGWWLTFDRQLSAERLRQVGFAEEREPIEGWIEAFRKFRAAGIIF
ncbi:sirq [Fusarium albosuccineum]|uniref:Sirq n=1 Tax=Fusarium albosuccineum TaxID=1237068 RepID=A0A8H4LFU1_9HYPO|nr:sirq [Fusarium albosuccineum]